MLGTGLPSRGTTTVRQRKPGPGRVGNSPASRTADGGAGIRTENSLTGEAVPELLGGRDKESVTFGHVNDSRSREFEGEGETQDSGCFSPYTLDLHVIKHPPQTANLCLDTNTQRPSRKPRLHRCVLGTNPQRMHHRLTHVLTWVQTQRHTEAHPGSSHTHRDNPDTRETHGRHTPGAHSLNLQVETAGAWNCCVPRLLWTKP